MTVNMTRKNFWFSDVFIFKDSSFAANDLSHPLSVSAQDYCSKQQGKGDGTGQM